MMENFRLRLYIETIVFNWYFDTRRDMKKS